MSYLLREHSAYPRYVFLHLFSKRDSFSFYVIRFSIQRLTNVNICEQSDTSVISLQILRVLNIRYDCGDCVLSNGHCQVDGM